MNTLQKSKNLLKFPETESGSNFVLTFLLKIVIYPMPESSTTLKIDFKDLSFSDLIQSWV